MQSIDRALARKINGALVLVLVVFFLAHGVWSSMAFNGMAKLLPGWVVWVGVVGLGIHIVVNVRHALEDHVQHEVRPQPVVAIVAASVVALLVAGYFTLGYFT